MHRFFSCILLSFVTIVTFGTALGHGVKNGTESTVSRARYQELCAIQHRDKNTSLVSIDRSRYMRYLGSVPSVAIDRERYMHNAKNVPSVDIDKTRYMRYIVSKPVCIKRNRLQPPARVNKKQVKQAIRIDKKRYKKFIHPCC